MEQPQQFAASPAATQACRVLLVDDSSDDRRLFREELERIADTSYEIFEACSGAEAYEVLQRINPNCLVLDYLMPGQNGMETLALIRERWSDLPVVVLSGLGDESIAVEAMKLGAFDYLDKDSLQEGGLHQVILTACKDAVEKRSAAEQRDALSTFTYALSHDLKEPIRTVKCYAQLLTEQITPEEKGEYLGYVESAADFMERLVERVHDFVGLDTGGSNDIQYASDLVSAALTNLDSLLNSRRCEVDCYNLPMLRVNRLQLVSVFQNLIGNAIRYNDQYVAKIQIRCSLSENHYLFSIADNGAGIDPRFLQRVFEPFKRLSSSERGTGLGLSIVKRIVEMHGGRIWVESEVGKGATFYFSLPCQGVAVENDDWQEPKAIDEEQGAVTRRHSNGKVRRKANILVVEDNLSDIRLTELMLQQNDRLHFNLCKASNGEEALHFLANARNPKVDLVLLDVNMPVLDGFGFLRELRRSDQKETPVIVCSTSEYPKDRERVELLGAKGYVVKPVRLQQLRPIIEGLPGLVFEQQGEDTLLSAAG